MAGVGGVPLPRYLFGVRSVWLDRWGNTCYPAAMERESRQWNSIVYAFAGIVILYAIIAIAAWLGFGAGMGA